MSCSNDDWGESPAHEPAHEHETETPDAHALALRLLIRREHASGELARKLQQRGVSREQAHEALAELAEQGWQSDTRFAAQFARDHAARGDGPLKIRAAMQQRGVSASLIDEALRELDVNWLAAASAARGKRFGADLPQDAAESMRQQRFLMTRGFEASDARTAVRTSDFEQD
ncbi:MAG: regulatory protein RecX [Halothiobacillaceae bacterium]|nr:regulatory protein RecX [Halothiobacillaceae bacterium]